MNPFKFITGLDDKMKAAIMEFVEEKASEKIAEAIPQMRITMQRIGVRAALINLQKDDPKRASVYASCLGMIEGD